MRERDDRAWALAAALFAFAVAATLSSVVFGRMPHVQDSIAQLFQARIFAGGRLWAPAPELPEFFAYTHMVLEAGRWYSQYPPGHALLLVPGVWLGQAWLVNPLLGALAVFGIHALGLELFDRRVARLASALAAVSPFLLFMSAEFMSHASSLAALTFYLLFYFRAVRSGSARDGALAGACLGLALLVRPLSALGLALPTLGHALVQLVRRPRSAARVLAAIALPALAAVALLLLYNRATTGDPLRFGYAVAHGPEEGLGLGRGGYGPPHTLERGLRAAWTNAVALNDRLLEWPLGSLWPVAIALSVPGGAVALRRRWLLACLPLGLQGVHVLYWYNDQCFGPRYLYEALAPVLLLLAWGLLACGGWLAAWLPGQGSPRWRTWLGVACLALLFAWAAAVRWPALFGAGRPLDPPASYFSHFGPEFWGASPYLERLVEREIEGRALVFTRSEDPSLRLPRHQNHWFGSAFAHQRPDLQAARVVYAHDLGPRNAELIARFPDRAPYLYRGTIRQGTLTPLSSTVYPAR